MNCWFTEKRYGKELLIFTLSYMLADSSLGFIGLLLAVFLAARRHLSFGRLIIGAFTITALVVGLYFASGNFRLRARDTAIALVSQDVSNTNGSTFALLSNLYVAGSSVFPTCGTANPTLTIVALALRLADHIKERLA